MKFAAAWWLAGMGVGLVVAIFFAFGGIGLLKAIRRFGRPEQVQHLLTGSASGRRATKSVLLVFAVMLCFIALAGPQYGRGTRLIPATNLDVVIALDYSKSMYARDVTPNRIERAKAEVGRLIRDLPGARFGAVGFAGQPLSFPLTSDGGAIAQFFRQLAPNDMPIGGTAIARALDAARGLFQRDPLSKKHKRVIVLVTDGEDLEGDPVNVARSAASEDISVHVVQIGGRAPEPIPDVAEDGTTTGLRRDRDGRPMTTQLSAQGEKQLTQIAESSGGSIVRSESGQTGIEEISKRLKALMTQELAERVETVYADVYYYPLGAAFLLLLLEAFVGQTPRRRSIAAPVSTASTDRSPQPGSASGPSSSKGARTALAISLVSSSFIVLGCAEASEVEAELFTRYSPTVDESIEALNANHGPDAVSQLTGYLSTGACQGGDLAVSDLVRQRPEAGFDLGLALFQVGETFGQRFGVEPTPNVEDPSVEEQLTARSAQVDCALRLVRVIAQQDSVSIELRAHAYYLAGNLEFLRRDYEAAVKNYDDSLRLWPGEHDPVQTTTAPLASPVPSTTTPEPSLSVGDRAAWNRAIALGRVKEQKDKEKEKDKEKPDAGTPEQDDKDESEQDDSKEDKQDENDEQDKQDPGDKPEDKPQGDQKDDQKPPQDQSGDDSKPSDDAQNQKQDQQDAQAQPKPNNPSLSNDDRILDLLEQAPTLQQAAARAQRGGATQHMEDK